MKKIRRTLGTIAGLVLSVAVFGTQVYAAGNINEMTLADDEEVIIFDTESSVDESENVMPDEGSASETKLYDNPLFQEDEVVEEFSGTVVEVNPIYEDIITEEELAEIIEANQEESEQQAGLFYSTPTQTFYTNTEIAEYLKQKEIERVTTEIAIDISVPVIYIQSDDGAQLMEYLQEAVEMAEEHTGEGSEGDYLSFNRLGQQVRFSGHNSGTNFVGQAFYTFSHFTTAEQEAEITDKLNNDVYPALALDGKTKTAKIQEIYGYITDNVTYDYDNLNNNSYLIKHATYAAIINGTAVCQGYATLLYRMMLENGIDARVITSQNHAWNIVGLGNVYYNVDSTWDANYGNNPSDWEWYMKCNSSFEDRQKDTKGDHQREAEYKTTDFNTSYPMTETDYDMDEPQDNYEIVQESDGKWYLYKDGEVDIGFSGIYCDNTTGIWWLVLEGVVPTDYSDIYIDYDDFWWKIKEGKVDTSYGDIYNSPTFGWLFVWEGVVDFSKTGEWSSQIYRTTVQIIEGRVVFPEENLPLVTNHRWNGPGWIVFTPLEDFYYSAQVVDADGNSTCYSDLRVLDGTQVALNVCSLFLKEGKYQFRIKTSSIRNDCDFESGAVSSWCDQEYRMPAARFDTPMNVRWEDDGTAAWDEVSGNPYYIVTLYKDSTFIAQTKTSNNKQKFFDSQMDHETLNSAQWTFSVTAFGADPGKIGASETVMSRPSGDKFNGLAADEYGNWYLYYNGEINSSFSGLYEDTTYGWWLVENGRVNFDYYDLYCDATVGWWKIFGGAVDFGYTDLYESPSCGWWKINGGAVDFGYTDLYESPSCGWWKVNGGAVDFGYTDLYGSPAFGWWKVNGGAVDFGYTDLYGSPGYGWWKVNGGAVDFGYTDLYGSPAYGWWKVSGGAVDFGYNDIFASPTCGYWKIAGGAVDFGYNGVYNSQRYGQHYISGGAVAY
jgi:aryl carrier-like protein